MLVFGVSSAGKSTLIKDMLFGQMLQFAQGHFIDHVTCSHQLGVMNFKSNIERNLTVKKRDLESDKDDMGKTMNSV